MTQLLVCFFVEGTVFQIVSVRGRKGTPSNLAFGSSFRDPCRAPLGSESLIHRGQGCLALGIITMPCLEPWLQMPTQLVSPGQFACPRPSLPLASTRPRRPCRSSHCRTPRREVAGLVGARLRLRCPKTGAMQGSPDVLFLVV